MSAQINYIAVLVSSVAYFLIGGIWYTVFAKPWMKAVGKTEEEIKQRASAVPYVGSFVGGLTAALVLALLIGYTGADTALAGIRVAFLGCVGFAVGATFGDYLFVGRARSLFFINHGYHLIGLAVMGAILAVWK